MSEHLRYLYLVAWCCLAPGGDPRSACGVQAEVLGGVTCPEDSANRVWMCIVALQSCFKPAEVSYNVVMRGDGRNVPTPCRCVAPTSAESGIAPALEGVWDPLMRPKKLQSLFGRVLSGQTIFKILVMHQARALRVSCVYQAQRHVK